MSDSPVKKLDFTSVGKENVPTSVKVDTVEKPVEKTLTKAEAIKAMEATEPLLQENPHRFVMFPIKYHEVSHVHHASSRVKWLKWRIFRVNIGAN